MNSGAGNRNLQLSDALHLPNSEDAQRMMNWLAVPKPRPTRKAEMAAAICQRLAGDPLRRLWSNLDEIQQLAVRETLYGS